MKDHTFTGAKQPEVVKSRHELIKLHCCVFKNPYLLYKPNAHTMFLCVHWVYRVSKGS